MDLTPLIVDPSIDIIAFARGFIERFNMEAVDNIKNAL